MIDVRGVKELKAIALVLKNIEQPLRTRINQASREALNPIWRGEVDAKVRTRQDAAILAKGARVKAGNPPVAQAATSTRAIGGRLRPADNWAPFEFGANREKVTTYDRTSTKGKRHKVTRHTARQLPPRVRQGRVIHPAFAEFAARGSALFVQLVVRVVRDAAEGKE